MLQNPNYRNRLGERKYMRVELGTCPAGVRLCKMGYIFGAYGKESDMDVENCPNKFTVDEKDIVKNWMNKGQFTVVSVESVKFIKDCL